MIQRVAQKLTKVYSLEEISDLFEVDQPFLEEIMSKGISVEVGSSRNMSPDVELNANVLSKQIDEELAIHWLASRYNKQRYEIWSVLTLVNAAVLTCSAVIPLFGGSNAVFEAVTICLGAINVFLVAYVNMMGFEAKAKLHEKAAQEYKALRVQCNLFFGVRDPLTDGNSVGEWSVHYADWPDELKQKAEAILVEMRGKMMELEKTTPPASPHILTKLEERRTRPALLGREAGLKVELGTSPRSWGTLSP